jgi:HTH-type transcriptional regulator / antitoxin HipB
MLCLLPNGGKENVMTVRSIRDLAAAVRSRRLDLGLNQADLARRAGVSRKWVYEFEAGKPSAELGLILRVLDALDLALELAPGEQARGGGERAGVDLDSLIDGHRGR